MALPARLIPALEERTDWPWHKVESAVVSVSAVARSDRRMDAATYLAPGARIRAALEVHARIRKPLGELARIWQPSRLKGIVVGPQYGTPFLAATQVFDLRPTARKWLAVERTPEANQRFVRPGTILVTCSGSVGRTVVAHRPHTECLISHDLLRVEVHDESLWGWVYAVLRTEQARLILQAAEYGHMIKHLEVAHLATLPIPVLRKNRRDHFTRGIREVYSKRDRAHDLTAEAEALFTKAVGYVHSRDDPERGFMVTSKRDGAQLAAEAEASFTKTVGGVHSREDPEQGFVVMLSAFASRRRRLEATFHSPFLSGLLTHYERAGRTVVPLGKLAERVWWLTRFRRVFGSAGVPYLSADELFSLNPPVSKRVLVEQAENAEQYFVRAGWIVMACSGQVYGALGSVALMTHRHEKAFFSHDIIRISPRTDAGVRPGYLLTALGHPTFGRPLVVRYAYGTSIPHLEPADIATLPIVRLDPGVEAEIAARAEEAASLRAEADDLEDNLTAEASAVLASVQAGDLADVEMVGSLR